MLEIIISWVEMRLKSVSAMQRQLYIALFSVSKQIHYTLVSCNSEWVSKFYTVCFLIPTKVVTALFGVKWLIPCQTVPALVRVLCTPYSHVPGFTFSVIQGPIRRTHVFCVHHTTMYQVSLSVSFKAPYVGHVCLAVICHLHFVFGQIDWDLLLATSVTKA